MHSELSFLIGALVAVATASESSSTLSSTWDNSPTTTPVPDTALYIPSSVDTVPGGRQSLDTSPTPSTWPSTWSQGPVRGTGRVHTYSHWSPSHTRPPWGTGPGSVSPSHTPWMGTGSAYLPVPTEIWTTIFPTTITSTKISFVPTSMPITDRGSTYYSTWLTTTLTTTVTVSTCTSTYEVTATPPAVPSLPFTTYVPIPIQPSPTPADAVSTPTDYNAPSSPSQYSLPPTYARPAIFISSSDSLSPAPTSTTTNDGASGPTCTPATTSTETQTIYMSGGQTVQPETVTTMQTVTVTGDAGPTIPVLAPDVILPAGTGGVAAPSGTGGAAMRMRRREWYGMGGKWEAR